MGAARHRPSHHQSVQQPSTVTKLTNTTTQLSDVPASMAYSNVPFPVRLRFCCPPLIKACPCALLHFTTTRRSGCRVDSSADVHVSTATPATNRATNHAVQCIVVRTPLLQQTSASGSTTVTTTTSTSANSGSHNTGPQTPQGSPSLKPRRHPSRSMSTHSAPWTVMATVTQHPFALSFSTTT